MTYELAFKPSALKEWRKLDATIQTRLKKKLAERLVEPHVASAALSGAANIYKIKLRRLGYRLVYSVSDKHVTVTVVAVGKRNRNEVYDVALRRLRGD